MTSIRHKTTKHFMKLGYEKQEIIKGIDNFNERLLWDVDSMCLIHSRKTNTWCSGRIMNIIVNEKTNEEWLKVKYKNNSTQYGKNVQRFNENIQPINSIQYDHKIVTFILTTLKAFKTMNLDEEINKKKVKHKMFDLSVFTNHQHFECDQNSSYKQCKSMKRLLAA
eukprot:173708_1